MLSHPLKKKLFIQKFDWNLVMTTMLELWLFLSHLVTMVDMKVMTNIQYQICLIQTVFICTRDHKKKIPKICSHIK